LSSNDHPLAGVLDRLIARERGDRPESPAEPDIRPSQRRMVALAAIGPGEGSDAQRALARWAVRQGLHPAAIDLACAEQEAESSLAVTRCPLASLPYGPERFKEEMPEVVSALLARLRKLEAEADLLIVRIPPSHRMTLMRAAFIAGGLVVPLEDSYDLLHEALRLSKEVMENFLDLPIWPYAEDGAVLERYQAMVREFLDLEPHPFSLVEGESADALEQLSSPPQEGFLAALLTSDLADPPPELLRIGSLRL
jgi:hypothetical protein